MIKFDVLNWFTGKIQFTAELDCTADHPHELKLGLAVHWALKNGASLVGASLVGARLDGARLDGARLDGARLPHFQIPQEGELTVWKKLSSGRLAKLLIPADAKRTISLVGRKCRAERVLVLAIFNGKKKETTGTGQHDSRTIYTVGEITAPDKYDGDIRIECTNGIHFFLTREEAESY